MKKSITHLLAALLFAWLFYREGAGLNLAIYGLLCLIGLYIRYGKAMFSSTNPLFATGAVTGIASILVTGSTLSVICLIASLLLLSVRLASGLNSTWLVVLNSLYAIPLSPRSSFQILKPLRDPDNQTSVNKWLVVSGSIVVFALFITLYRFMSAGFNEFIANLNLDFISPRFIVYFITGLFLAALLVNPVVSARLGLFEKRFSSFVPSDSFTPTQFGVIEINQPTEATLAKSILGGLTVLLLIVNITDTGYLFRGELPANTSYYQYVHQGINSLILSILLAIGILLWFFRDTSFSKDKSVSTLAICWILLNTWLVLSSGYRNWLYIEEYGLTYKRIGVFIFLVAATAGLLLTFQKSLRTISTYTFLSRLSLSWFLILVISCPVNWDRKIAEYSIQKYHSGHKLPDINYLYSLSPKTYPAIAALLSETNSDTTMQVSMINSMIYNLVRNEDNFTWKSMNLERMRIYKELYEAIPPYLYPQIDLLMHIKLKRYYEYRHL